MSKLSYMSTPLLKLSFIYLNYIYAKSPLEAKLRQKK